MPGDRVRMGLTVLELRSEAQVAAQASAVRPMPEITRSAPTSFDPPPRPTSRRRRRARPSPSPRRAHRGCAPRRSSPRSSRTRSSAASAEGAGREGYDSLAALVDSRVKRQTNVAAFALLAIAALAVIIYLGLTL